MKNVLVTGVSRGLGLEISRLLLLRDYKVFGVCRSSSKFLVDLAKQYSNRLSLSFCNLANIDVVNEKIFSNDFISLETPLDGFVNNAAIAYDDIITNIRLAPLEEMFRVNVFSPFLISKQVVRNMLLHNTEGSIVHISSISVHTGYKGLAMYASTKGALEAFSKNTAREWGSRGIRSNSVVAGFMETGMSSSLSQEQKERIYKRNSLKKATNIESVAETVEFLLSECANSITGQNIFVDNGTI